MKKIFFILLALALPYCNAQSQCKLNNSYFKEGETLTYDLYYKYGMIYTKAGHSSLTVTAEKYNGQEAYRMALQARSSGAAKTFFALSDTMISYTTKDVAPLAYTKKAHEGKDHTVENATYKYSGGNTHIQSSRVKNGNMRYDTTLVANSCIYDMLSIVYYARTLDYSNMEKGDKVTVSFLSGRKLLQMEIQYQGLDKVKANDDNRYNCIKLVLTINNPAFEDKDEAMKVYLTDDFNRVPVRIDSKLKVGSTRVVMNKYEGLRN